MNKQSNFPKFMLLRAGELISTIGGGLTSFGLGVYVFRQTGSAASMALVTLLAFLPTLLLSVSAGVLADRYDRRLLMIGGRLFGAGYSLHTAVHDAGRSGALANLHRRIHQFHFLRAAGAILSSHRDRPVDKGGIFQGQRFGEPCGECPILDLPRFGRGAAGRQRH